jgi:hypothetical protein
MRATRTAVTFAVCLVLGACTADDGALDLPADDAQVAPSTDAAPVEPRDGDDAGADVDDDLPYPPLPALEPDPSSDVSEEEQMALLEVHAQVYEATQSAFASSSYPLDELPRFLGEPALSEAIRTAERYRENGQAVWAPDAAIEWVRVVEARGGPATIHECRRHGPETGLYDEATGELLEAVAVQNLLLEVRYDVEMIDGRLETLAVEVSGREAGESCDE